MYVSQLGQIRIQIAYIRDRNALFSHNWRGREGEGTPGGHLSPAKNPPRKTWRTAPPLAQSSPPGQGDREGSGDRERNGATNRGGAEGVPGGGGGGRRRGNWGCAAPPPLSAGKTRRRGGGVGFGSRAGLRCRCVNRGWVYVFPRWTHLT